MHHWFSESEKRVKVYGAIGDTLCGTNSAYSVSDKRRLRSATVSGKNSSRQKDEVRLYPGEGMLTIVLKLNYIENQ